MRKKLPTILLVLAILQFVFATFGICGSAVQISGIAQRFSAMAPRAPGQADPQAELEAAIEKQQPNYRLQQRLGAAAEMLLCFTMIAGGVGLLLLRPWGRWLTVGYAGFSIIMKIIVVVYGFLVIVPAAYDVAKELMAKELPVPAAPGVPNVNQMVGQALPIGIIIGLIVNAAVISYPIGVLVVLFWPSVVSAFRDQKPVPGTETDTTSFTACLCLIALTGFCSIPVDGSHRDRRLADIKGASDTNVTELKIVDLQRGTGREAKAGDTVVVHYTLYLKNGKKIDSSIDRGPFQYKLGAGQVIKGWEQGVPGMKVGGKRKLIIPPKLGYGERGAGPIPANAQLTFEIELLKIQ